MEVKSNTRNSITYNLLEMNNFLKIEYLTAHNKLFDEMMEIRLIKKTNNKCLIKQIITA